MKKYLASRSTTKPSESLCIRTSRGERLPQHSVRTHARARAHTHTQSPPTPGTTPQPPFSRTASEPVYLQCGGSRRSAYPSTSSKSALTSACAWTIPRPSLRHGQQPQQAQPKSALESPPRCRLKNTEQRGDSETESVGAVFKTSGHSFQSRVPMTMVSILPRQLKPLDLRLQLRSGCDAPPRLSVGLRYHAQAAREPRLHSMHSHGATRARVLDWRGALARPRSTSRLTAARSSIELGAVQRRE